MSVSDDFGTFYDALAVDKRDAIPYRYAELTKRLNGDFWDSESEIYHSLSLWSRYTGRIPKATPMAAMLVKRRIK